MQKYQLLHQNQNQILLIIHIHLKKKENHIQQINDKYFIMLISVNLNFINNDHQTLWLQLDLIFQMLI